MSGKRLRFGRSLTISEDALEERFVQSSGPGGQNVNKVATAVQLRFGLWGSRLPQAVKRRAAELAGSKLTKDGDILIRANEHRSLSANREAARARLLALLEQAAEPPRRRVKTRASRAAKRRRVDRKVQRGRVKALRATPET